RPPWPRWQGPPRCRWPDPDRPGRPPAGGGPRRTARTRRGTVRAGRFRPVRDCSLSGATRGYLAYDGPALARPNASGLTSRRPFTLLGILLALLVIAAFVLVAINASAGQGTTMASVVVAT